MHSNHDSILLSYTSFFAGLRPAKKLVLNVLNNYCIKLYSVCVCVCVCVCLSVFVSQKFAVHWGSHHGAPGKAHWGTIGRAIGGHVLGPSKGKQKKTDPKMRMTPRIKMIQKIMTIQIEEEPKNEDNLKNEDTIQKINDPKNKANPKIIMIHKIKTYKN